MDENAEDELFREFEDSYSLMELGRSDFTPEEKKLIQKFKLMKNMIVYLQRIPLFGKFCFHGLSVSGINQKFFRSFCETVASIE